MKYNWSKLNRIQIGRYAEYYAKMEFTLYDFDVYTTEVDDKGIDFVVRRDSQVYFDIQVKSVRGYNYIYMRKEVFQLSQNLLLAVFIFEDGSEPTPFLIPSTVWKNPDNVFVSRDYENGKSKPEWGINLSKKNLNRLDEYSFEKVIQNLQK